MEDAVVHIPTCDEIRALTNREKRLPFNLERIKTTKRRKL